MFFNYDSTTYNDAPRKDLQDIAMELLQAFDVSRLRQSPLVRALHWLSDEICFGQKLMRNRSEIVQSSSCAIAMVDWCSKR